MNTDNVLKMILTSNVRYRVLLAISERPKTLGEIHEEVGSTKSTISHALSDLMEEKLITQDPETKKYYLTNLGLLVSGQIRSMIDALEVIKSFEDFWLAHDLSGIPEPLLLRIGDLKGAKIHRVTPESLRPPHQVFMELLKTSEWVKGVSPILFTDYPREFMSLALEKGVDIEIITTPKVYEKLIEMSEPEVVGLVKEAPNVRLYIIEENPKVAFTVTNNFLSLGLFFPNGTYDMTSDIIATTERAKRWGIELFEHYKKNAKRVL
ncbi:winged helix-turn-helix domain-containing protein [Thermococcus sp.]|uniref:helix-turn-helix transcriptional regulator n=1 Tax=Thermococcus sp. TaxID=35749 RepID=UPI0026039D61|nr:winged helix-turn-helix domain-containing protein [Thermococcus sp.]